MQIDLFIVLIFVVVIILALTSKDITVALIIIALMANFALLYREFRRSETMENDEMEPVVAEETMQESDRGLYGDEQEFYDTYINSYGDSHSTNSPVMINSPSERDYSVDNATVDMSIRRFREKKAQDGFAVKDSDFYRHHFAKELDESERKRWWGNGEY